jgi:spore coat protein H
MRTLGSLMKRSFVPAHGCGREFFRFAAALLQVLWFGSSMAGLLAGGAEPASAAPSKFPKKSADVFRGTNIWTVHLKFTAAQWEQMEPKGGGGFRGRGGLGGPSTMSPATLLAPAFLAGDQNGDGKLSLAEFCRLAERWFAEWKTNESGGLEAGQLQAGLNSTFALAGLGGDGGRGLAFRLQGPEGQRNGLAAASGIEFEYVHADLEFEGRLIQDVGVRYKGNGTFMRSRNSLKRSLKIDLDRYVQGQKLAGLAKWNLHNCVTDPSWMNEVMSHRLFRDAGVPAPRTAYARLFVTVPGKFDRRYFGLYSVVEDIDKHFAAEVFGTKDGAIFKPVTPNLFDYLGEDWGRYNQTYDPKTALPAADRRRLIDLARLVTRASDTEFAQRIGSYLDLEEFARFMAVTTWLPTLDSLLALGQNYYVYLHPKTGKLQFLPWDLDHSFGQFPMAGTQQQREQLSIHQPWRGENRFLARVFKVEAFQKLYLARMTEFSQGIFKPERLAQQVDEIAQAIRPAIKEESASMLARFEEVVAGRPVSTEGGRGGGQITIPIKPFVKTRAQSVLDQLAGKSTGEVLSDNRMGGFAGRGGGRGRGRGGFFEPTDLAASAQRAFMAALDADKDGVLTLEEFKRGFTKWFEAWNPDKTGQLTEAQLRSGLNRDLQAVTKP